MHGVSVSAVVIMLKSLGIYSSLTRVVSNTSLRNIGTDHFEVTDDTVPLKGQYIYIYFHGNWRQLKLVIF